MAGSSSTRQPASLGVRKKEKSYQALWTLLMQICAGRDLRVEKSKCISAIRAIKGIHPKRSLRWRESVDVTPLSSGGGHSPGFVRIYKRIQPTNSSAWEKDSPPGSWNKNVLPLFGWR